MCGIFAVLSSIKNDPAFEALDFHKGQERGPENSVLSRVSENILFGFHRLAINGYSNPESEQPICIGNCVLICNGEIYNWKELHGMLNIPSKTGSDCEIIIHLYKTFGIEYTLNKLDGVFSFVLYDKEKDEVFIARDPFGVRPLFISTKKLPDNYFYMFASELKMMTGEAVQFEPGTYAKIKQGVLVQRKYYNIVSTEGGDQATYKYLHSIRDNLISAVKKRIVNTDREIACLLSGGLDSSLITALVAKFHGAKNLHTWSIGMKGSEDLKYAKKVADYLCTNHHSIELEPSEFIEAIEQVIQAIESYDTTTVRASVGNWLISKYIKANSNAKVIFNGDGSDEVTGGYMYFHYAPNALEFDNECKRLLKDIHYFDVLRSDRCIASHGLEARTPFLDKNFVQSYLSIPAELRYKTMKDTGIEKYLLRKAFDSENVLRWSALPLLPQEVLWRTKEAFSDGVSSQKESWFQMIQTYAKEKYKNMDGPTAEKYLYKEIFNKYYPDREVIPYMWMPKFVSATDASARTLDVYKSIKSVHANPGL
jgi:asparagine synthase (glutamine-hydrolysing)